MPTVGSLFAGIGGLDLGLEHAGWTVKWQVEIDPFCQRVLAKHWPDVARYGDIKTLDLERLERVDLICGGFPCQPVSVAGKRLAQADARWLWPEFGRVIRALRPRLVLVENVPGLLGRGFGDVVGDLAASGYDAEWDCVGAADLGAPHQRDRVWIVAYPRWPRIRDQRPAGVVLGSQGAGEGQGTERQWVWPDARDGGAVVPDADGRRRQEQRQSEPGRIEGARRREPDRLGEDGQLDDAAPMADAAGPGRRSESAGSRSPASGRSEATWRLQLGRLGGEVADAAGQRLEAGLLRGRARAHPTIAASDHWAVEPDVGRVAHGVPARVDRLRGLGNAVVPQVAEWLGRRLLAALDATGVVDAGAAD